MSRLLITGANGQLGRAVRQQAQGQFDICALGRAELDITSRDAVQRIVSDFSPDVVVNAAAYTAVDSAESNAAFARNVNVDGARFIAEACRENGARMLHISTDFVFDGRETIPYRSSATTNPLSVYGQTKLDGELAVREELPNLHTIVRTAWVYGPVGQNFVKTMIRLLGMRDELRVVCDQLGTPTSTTGLAGALVALIDRDLALASTLHWTDAGVASWFDLASAVRDFASKKWPSRQWARVRAIPTADYPTPAERPRFGILDCSESWAILQQPPHWAEVLRQQLSSHDEYWSAAI